METTNYIGIESMMNFNSKNNYIALNKLVAKTTKFLKKENEEVCIVLKNTTEEREIYIGDFSNGNTFLKNKAEQNLLEVSKTDYVKFSIDTETGKMNGAISIWYNFDKFVCSTFGMINLIDNVFISMKILERYNPRLKFEKILTALDFSNETYNKETLLEMNENFLAFKD